MIPKIIHYCWLSDDSIPAELQSYMNSWKKLDGYQFILWDRKRFNINSSIWVKQAFEAKKYAFAADYIRLYAVYTMGGIYLDCDIEIIEPFDKLLDNTTMIAYTNSQKIGIEAACFGAERNCLYIKKCLDYYNNRSFVKSDGTYDIVTLPVIMKKIFDDFEIPNTILLYPHDYFSATGEHSGQIKITDNTYCVHHCAGTWLDVNEQKWRLFRKKCLKIFGHGLGSILSFFYFFLLCIKYDDMKLFNRQIKEIVKTKIKYAKKS
jgi:mannosyltransferase OCH1-like enzyme